MSEPWSDARAVLSDLERDFAAADRGEVEKLLIRLRLWLRFNLERSDPREDWRCGTCAYWRKGSIPEYGPMGQCWNAHALITAWGSVTPEPLAKNWTREDFGCRFWSAKSLKDKGADIPIALHNEGSPTS